MLRPFYGQRLRWRACGRPFQCSTLQVPLDYAHPAQGTVGIAAVRLPAANGARRLGSLVVNPGGPGASGIDYARSGSSSFSPTLLRRFDIVGFDPRGVGASDPIVCLSDRQTDTFLATDASPDNPAEVAQLDEQAKLLARLCEQHSPRLLPHVGTRDVARDLDVLRAALGEATLNFLGKSYGTLLGATYAELFPRQVGRFVLDGAVDPALSDEQLSSDQAVSFDVALRAFVADCLRRRDCPVRGTPDQALARIRALLAQTDRRPLPSDEGRPVTQALATFGVVASLYDATFGWELLRQALEVAFDGDGSLLLYITDLYTSRDDKGHYTDNGNVAIYAVNCLDRASRATPTQLSARAARLRARVPEFGPDLAWSSLPCTYWRAPATDHPHPIAAAGARPILVVGTTGDPATPYHWAQALAGELDSGVLLTWVGNGHTAYDEGSSCVDSAVDAFLVAATVPPNGKTCR